MLSEGSHSMKMCLKLTYCAFSSSPSKDATMSKSLCVYLVCMCLHPVGIRRLSSYHWHIFSVPFSKDGRMGRFRGFSSLSVKVKRNIRQKQNLNLICFVRIKNQNWEMYCSLTVFRGGPTTPIAPGTCFVYKHQEFPASGFQAMHYEIGAPEKWTPTLESPPLLNIRLSFASVYL